MRPASAAASSTISQAFWLAPGPSGTACRQGYTTCSVDSAQILQDHHLRFSVSVETYIIFEFPGLQSFREQWSHLFGGPQTMQGFMWEEDLIGVAKFVTACMNKMNPSLQGQASDQPGVAGRDVISSDLIYSDQLLDAEYLQAHACVLMHSGLARSGKNMDKDSITHRVSICSINLWVMAVLPIISHEEERC